MDIEPAIDSDVLSHAENLGILLQAVGVDSQPDLLTEATNASMHPVVKIHVSEAANLFAQPLKPRPHFATSLPCRLTEGERVPFAGCKRPFSKGFGPFRHAPWPGWGGRSTRGGS